MQPLSIVITNQQRALPIDRRRLRRAVEGVLREAGIVLGEVSVAVVDDPTIHQINRRHLNHDWPTDVLSFLLERTGPLLEAELIVSTETAIAQAAQFGWKPADELLLYVIHGALHLVGWDDHTPKQRAAMEACQAKHLARFRLVPRYETVADSQHPEKPKRTTSKRVTTSKKQQSYVV